MPTKLAGATPTIVKSLPLMRTLDPMAAGDAADTLEVVDVAQLLARSVLKDKTPDGRAALYGMDAAFLL